MFLYNHFNINEKGHLCMDGADTVDIAKTFGTPLYVISRKYIENAINEYHRIMRANFGDNYTIAYASKALSAKFIYDIIKDMSVHADVVSGGEIYTALAGGMKAENLHFHGGNKTRNEIGYALSVGIGSFVIDNFQEIAIINDLAKAKNITANVILRVKPGVDAHTHEFIQTGKEDTKFGFGIKDGKAFEALDAIISSENLNLIGIHCHIGSQLLESKPFAMAGGIMADFMAEIREKYGITLPHLIMGGGFGVKYTYNDKPESLDDMIKNMADAIKSSCAKNNFPLPHITIEPGRSVVAPSGITLYEVGTVKELPGIRNYVSVDGGMTDNPRYALYDARYECVIADRAGEKRDYLATIAGKCCESGDLVTKDIYIQKPQPGDILAVFTTGAYNFSMASNYNKTPRPPLVLIENGKPVLKVRGETYEDLIRLEI
ncbi:MAG: diaminopimelate decarboxylase [Clostridia bacterium]|nr:diaminopimelate decarboxylase [Clostridia bacterium]